LLFSCKEKDNRKDDIVIVYTNDIHSYVGNTTKDENDNKVPGLRLNNVSGYVKELKKEYKNVLLVDAGDEVQGTFYGSIDSGVDIIDIMNKTGYDLATPGNHDFDFGVPAFFGFVEQANFPYISCNMRTVADDKNVLDSYKVFNLNGKKVAFVGMTTPDTIPSSTPKFFQDDNGNYVYKFVGQGNSTDLFDVVQDTIDEIKENVDYIIGLGHLGIGADEERKGIRSIDVIQHTSGFDAVIDAHSHDLLEKGIYKDKENKDVILTQTGCYLEGVGVMTISTDGKIDTKVINEIEEKDSKVKALEDALISRADEALGQKIAALDNKLYIKDPTTGKRMIRARETNLGNIASDSIYWYLNEEKDLNCDIAIVNGGGLRTDIEVGDVTYKMANDVMPFGNVICLIKTKGINIKNALEMGVNICDEIYTKDEYAENGGFLHAAGIKFDVDVSIPTSVETDTNDMFVKVDGEYRVKNLKVYNKETKLYEDLDENKYYTVGGINYILRNAGNGMSMFNDSELVLDYIGEDYLVFADYLKAFDNSINNQNSPLKSYENYLYDYENPYGSGRIRMVGLPG
ncbi:MAG: bifunctional metallophosphatase/5'-nucleotidase, partial [Acholeplasmatales bacterium]|nr:bifunctional metallophosphatase/5'-nucleotidase [Acholeplasmatales bacterium]